MKKVKNNQNGPGRGGKRAGAGRPVVLRRPFRLFVLVEDRHVEWLDAQAANRSAVVRGLIDAAAARAAR